MADPISSVTVAPPQRETRTKKWIAGGATKNPEEAKRRIVASRKTRAKPRQKTVLSVSVPYEFAKAIESMSDRWDIPRAMVVKRFFRDGIRRYGSPEEIANAGLNIPEKTNPFIPAMEPMPAIHPTVPFYPAVSNPPILIDAPLLDPNTLPFIVPSVGTVSPRVTAAAVIEDDNLG